MKRLILLLFITAIGGRVLAQDITSDLYLYYPLNGSYENQVNNALNYGVPYGAPQRVTGFDGTPSSAYYFNGTSNLSFGDIDLTTESFTVSFWMKLNGFNPSSTISYRVISQRAGCDINNFFDVVLKNTATEGYYTMFMEMYGGSAGYNGTVQLGQITDPFEWNLITIVKDNASRSTNAYINGHQVGSAAWTTPNNTDILDLTTGADFGISTSECINGNNVKNFIGHIDDLRLYKRALSSGDVMSLIPYNLVSQYPADGAEKTSITSDIALVASRAIDASAANSSNISVTGSISGALSPAFSVDGETLRMSFPNHLPYGEEITVTYDLAPVDPAVSNLTGTFSFTTATREESKVVKMSFDGNLTDEGSAGMAWASTVGSAIYVADASGNASSAVDVTFNARAGFTNSMHTIPPAGILNFGKYEDFTVSSEFKSLAATANDQVIFKRINGSVQVEIHLNTSGNLELKLSDADQTLLFTASGADLRDNQWHSMLVSADREGDISLYVDNVENLRQATPDFNLDLSGYAIVGGNMVYNDPVAFNGHLDNFAIYNRSFTAAEVANINATYLEMSPENGKDYIALDQEFTLSANNAITVSAANVTLTGSKSGSHTATVTGSGSRAVTISSAVAFEEDEDVTLSITGITDNFNQNVDDQQFSYKTYNIQRGMLVYYPFDGNTENQASDEYDGQVQSGSIGYIENRDGSANSAINLSAGALSIGDLPISNGSFAISFWMLRDNTTNSQVVVAKREICSTANQLQVISDHYQGKFRIWLSISSTSTGTHMDQYVESQIYPYTWTHVTAVRDNSAGTVSLYINGELAESKTINTSMDLSNSAIMGIGAGSACIGGSQVSYSGSIDEFRFYDRAVTADEAAQLPTLVLVQPTLAHAIDDLTIIEDEGALAIADLDTVFASTASMTYSVVSDNPEISATLDGSNLIIEASADYHGEAEITVTANSGLTLDHTFTVTISSMNDAPEFSLSSTRRVLPVNFGDGFTVRLTDHSPANESDQVITYSIDPASVPFAGVSINPTTGYIAITEVLDGAGSQIFTITADDGQAENNTFSSTFELVITNNQAPTVAFPVNDLTINEDTQTIAIGGVSTNFTDADGDQLTFAASSSNESIVATIENDNLVITPASNYTGSAVITVTASDAAASAQITFSVTVSPVNDTPELIGANTYELQEDGAQQFVILSGLFKDVDGDRLTYTLEYQNEGKLNVEIAEGALMMTPVPNANGTVSFTIVVSDGNATLSEELTVNIVAVNDAPSLSGTSIISLNEDDAPLSVSLNDYFNDIDGDVLSYSIVREENASANLFSSAISQTTLTITPAANAFGSQGLTINISDGTTSIYQILTISISAVNDAPALIGNPVFEFQEDASSQGFNLRDLFGDVDGDALSYQVNVEDATAISAIIAEGTLIVQPQPDFFGTAQFSVTVSDGTASETFDFDVTVAGVNDLPVVSGEVVADLQEDGSPITIDLMTIFGDVDGDELTFSYHEESGLSELVTLVLVENVLTITPELNAFGSGEVTLQADDAEGSAQYTLAIQVASVNDAPVFTLSKTSFTLEQDFESTETISITLNIPANEADETITYSVSPNDGALVNITINANTVEITAVAGAFGQETFTLVANDGQSENATYNLTFDVTVNKALTLGNELALVNVYPNPATAYIMLETAQTVDYQIFNLQGVAVAKGKSNEKTTVEHLTEGLYIIRYQSAGKAISQKLTIKR